MPRNRAIGERTLGSSVIVLILDHRPACVISLMFPPSHFPPIPIGVCFCQCFVCKSAYVAHSQRVRYVTRSVRCRVFPTVLTPMLCLEAFPSKRMCNRPLRNSRNRGGDSVWGPFFGFYFLFFSYQGLLHVVGIQRHRFDRPGPQLAGMSRNWQKKWFSTFFFGQLHSFSVFLLLNFFRCVAQETSSHSSWFNFCPTKNSSRFVGAAHPCCT